MATCKKISKSPNKWTGLRKVVIYEEVVTKIDYQDDLFKDLSTDESEDTTNDVWEECNLLLDADAELSINRGKPNNAEILAEIGRKPFDEEEMDNALKFENELAICPTSLKVDKAVAIQGLLFLLCRKGNGIKELYKRFILLAKGHFATKEKENHPRFLTLKV